MREISINELKPIANISFPILHTSGVPVLMPGDELTQAAIDLIKETDTETLLFLDGGDQLEKIRHEILNIPVGVDFVKEGQKLSRAIYDENGILLIGEEGAITPDFVPSLKRRGITTLYFRKSDDELKTNLGIDLRNKISQITSKQINEQISEQDQKSAAALEDEKDSNYIGPKIKQTIKPAIETDPKKIFAPENIKTINDIKFKTATLEDLQPHKIRQRLNKPEATDFKPKGEPFEDLVLDIRKKGAVSDEEKETYVSAVDECLSLLESIFHDLKVTGKFFVNNLDDIASKIIAGTVANRNLLIMLSLEKSEYNYLTTHSLATAVLAVNIGSAMGYGTAQIKSLAYSALLADIGLLKLPERIINKQSKLTSLERDKIQQHTTYGIEMLRSTPGLPTEVPYVIYQSHEQPNGKGYPCGKRNNQIHPFAKIVRAADMFTALCADRPYRESQNPYMAMEKLVFMTSEGIISAEVTKSLLRVVSLFSVGSFVLLADQSIARIITSNPDDYMRPVVSIIWDKDGNEISVENRLDLMEHPELSVLRILDEKERIALDSPMAGF